MDRLFLSPPHISGKEFDYVKEAFDSNWIAPAGPHLRAFEQEILHVFLENLRHIVIFLVLTLYYTKIDTFVSTYLD